MHSLGLLALLLAAACSAVRHAEPPPAAPATPEAAPSPEPSGDPQPLAAAPAPDSEVPTCRPVERRGQCLDSDASYFTMLTPDELRRIHPRFDGDVPILELIVSLHPGCELPDEVQVQSPVRSGVMRAEVRGVEAMVELCEDPRVRTVQVLRGGKFPTYGRETRTIRAELRLGEFETRGPGDPDAIRKQLRRHVAGLRSCYERALGADTMIEGELTVGYTVDADGRVRSSKLIRSTMGADDLDACIVETLRRIRYEPAEGSTASTHVKQTLILHTHSEVSIGDQ